MTLFFNNYKIPFSNHTEFKKCELNVGKSCMEQGLYFLNGVNFLDAPDDIEYKEKIWGQVLTIDHWGVFAYQLFIHDTGIWYRGTYTNTFDKVSWINLGSQTLELESLEERISNLENKFMGGVIASFMGYFFNHEEVAV